MIASFLIDNTSLGSSWLDSKNNLRISTNFLFNLLIYLITKNKVNATIKKLTNDGDLDDGDLDEDYLVEFNFKGKLSFNNANQLYIAYFNRADLFNSCNNFAPDLLSPKNIMTFNPDIYINGFKVERLITSGELQLKYNGNLYPERISTSILFTLKVNAVTYKQD